MKWILAVVAILASLVVLPLAVGSLLPTGHRATVGATVHAPPERVWSAITDVHDFPRWRPAVERIEDADARVDPSQWTEIGANGPLPMEVVEREPGRRLVVRIVDEGLPFGGTWTYELSEHPDGARLDVTEDGRVYNPVFRFVARFLIGHERTLRTYLGALTSDLGGSVDP